MSKKMLLALLAIIFTVSVNGQNRRVKNVILMIPDGTSWATVSSARWYQRYLDPNKQNLHLDPYLCGSVLTYSSNAPVGDSAPTTSCFMTGVPSQAGFVSTYPPADPKNDIIPLDSTMAYQPLMTVLEAAKIFNKMAAGLVFTCEFPHATPADCASHTYNRSKYSIIVPQMVHNNIDVLIGGGTKHLDDECKNYLLKEGYGIYMNDIAGFRSHKGNKMWSLFCDDDMPYDLDRDEKLYPSIAEMTAKAIEKLSENENGFFLMVEGSKVDWAAHANDPIAMITDLLAFDEAFGVATDFAKKNGETVVIAVPDHGNSGISIGSNRCPNYSTLTKDDLFKNISQFKASAETIIKILKNTERAEIKSTVKKYTGIDLSDKEMEKILSSRDYGKTTLTAEERMKGSSMKKVLTDILNSRTCFGFTSGGHTGEEVFLAVYVPENSSRPTGFITNIEINKYMSDILKIGNLEEHTANYFAKHSEVFSDYRWKINNDNKDFPVLEVESNRAKGKLTVNPFSNTVMLNGKEIRLNSVVVYVDRTNTFYLPKSLREIFNN
ncbi:MAG: alkaline phosphatase [Prevotellaceae bacterium]|nr:alkaline phosphatase [Prevotellaceae bacterium]